jgi:hypothetical protein
MKPSNTPSLAGGILILCLLLACPFPLGAQAVKKSPPPSPTQNSAFAKPAPPKPAATKPAATPAPEQHPMPEPRQQHPVPQQPQPKPSAQQPQQQHQVAPSRNLAPGGTPLASPATKASNPAPVDPLTTVTPWIPVSAGRGAKPMAANPPTRTAPTAPLSPARKPSNAPVGTPLVPGTATHPGGGKTLTTPAGNRLDYRNGGQLDSIVTNKGTQAHFDHGKVSTIKTASGMTIVHSPAGGRHIVTEHRDVRGHLESRVVSTGPNRGFAEHAVERGGHEYMHRTYVREGRTYTAVSRGYYYHGILYYHYVPAYYYAPTYYAWGYGPWGEPIAYTGWGWVDSPWYGWSGYYFAPYPVYPSAAFWLADYVLAENLKAAYEAQAAANTAAANADAAAASANAAAANANASAGQQGSQGGAAALTPEVKEMIAEEIKAQLAAEQTAAQPASATGLAAPQQSIADSYRAPAALDPNRRVFIVSSHLEVSVNDQPCILRPGDVLNRTETVPDKDNTVAVYVLKSQKSDCAAGTTPRIQVADLQEMHNHFREQMDAGLKTLADNQGKNGLPSAPAAASPHVNADGTATPDDAAAIGAQLNQQQLEAEQAETEVQQAAPPSGPLGNNNERG